jgi:hypothetical protein
MIYMSGLRCKGPSTCYEQRFHRCVCASSLDTSGSRIGGPPGRGRSLVPLFFSPERRYAHHVLGDSEDNNVSEDRGEERPYDHICLSSRKNLTDSQTTGLAKSHISPTVWRPPRRLDHPVLCNSNTRASPTHAHDSRKRTRIRRCPASVANLRGLRWPWSWLRTATLAPTR